MHVGAWGLDFLLPGRALALVVARDLGELGTSVQ